MINNFVIHFKNNNISGQVLKLLRNSKDSNVNKWNNINQQFLNELQSTGLWLPGVSRKRKD